MKLHRFSYFFKIRFDLIGPGEEIERISSFFGLLFNVMCDYSLLSIPHILNDFNFSTELEPIMVCHSILS